MKKIVLLWVWVFLLGGGVSALAQENAGDGEKTAKGFSIARRVNPEYIREYEHPTLPLNIDMSGASRHTRPKTSWIRG